VNSEKKFFGEERLLAAVSGGFNAQTTVENLNRAVGDFAQGCEAFDDYTVLAITLQKPVTKTGKTDKADGLKLTLAPQLASLQKFRDVLFQTVGAGFDQKKIYLACEEALTNVISYSGATQIGVELAQRGSVLTITISDDGVAFNPLAAQAEEKAFDAFADGGMGISLIQQLAVASYARGENCNVLTLKFTAKTSEN
jgi:anti-sigma regulatory factor (Ser/Thr protein kinase)